MTIAVALLLLAAEQYAVFQSTDRGQTWSRAGIGLPAASRIHAFASLDSTVFAATDSGVFVSHDAGYGWRPAAATGRVLALAVLGNSLFAGTDRGGVLASPDHGRSWMKTGLPPYRVRSLAADGAQLYAGTDADGVFVSSDAGQTWRSLAPGLPAHAQVFALAVHSGRLFAALYAKGLYAWTGQRWIAAGRVTPLEIAAVGDTLIAGHNPGGIFWSSDGGSTWTPHTGGLPRTAPIWAMGSHNHSVFAGAADGIFYSLDRGRTWVRAKTGLPVRSPGVAFLVKDGLVLAAVN